MTITSRPYGALPSGEPVKLFTLTNERGMTVSITDFGGIVVSIEVPDRNGILADVVLGKPDFAGYFAGHPHMGAIAGRVAGRLTGGRFTLDGVDYQLALNNGANHLHGGLKGFDKELWLSSVITEDGQEKLRLRHRDLDGANGYPGNVDCQVDYAVTSDNELRIDYQFVTDKATPLVVTNHSYFNLKGQGEGQILDHEVQIFAHECALADDEMTLLSKKVLVDGTASDFREPAVIGDRVDRLHQGHGDGYFLPDGRTIEPRLVARVREAHTGRVLETLTTEPYIQFYTGSQMEEGEPGKTGSYGKHSAFCLEAQEYPDAVNAPDLGVGVLRPGEDFRSTTIYRFSAE
ncbi:aldose epimerase family protein [Cerasicoccus arenae]|uniref:Aldose 1-epimerase n=1 Tax=Cerasicoccus arenae TaxID=424488 RepID=A0A8J3DHV8_9BACT|nr:aldose epimerase family protein [Cerasicoccus arenae]MBK1858269.1 galactose mutarotase [Cerasicoccus arenae]GHC02296.1 aldose 1-epimerase [Cerasicoccus arenae]